MPENHSQQRPVVVIGMGPVGLVAALALARAGIPVTVLEAGPDLSAESRASTFHPPSIEILRDLGVVDQLHEQGLVAPVVQYRNARGVVAAFDSGALKDQVVYPYRIQCEQNKLTQIIREVLVGMDGVELHFSAPVSRVEQGTDCARVFLQGDSREPSYLADWVVAADGASSNVRKGLGIAFEGVTLPERFLVASTTHDFHDEDPDLAYVSYISDPHDWAVLLRTPAHWRILMPIQPGVPDEIALSEAEIQRRLQRIHPIKGEYPLDHSNIYDVNQRVAATFAVGRVLLAGDAAHVNNPLGGMGMNSGIHDAMSAATTILAAFSGADPTRCAEAYDHARRTATIEHVQRQTKKNYREMKESDATAQSDRSAALAAAAADPVLTATYLRESLMLDSWADSQARLTNSLRRAVAQRPAASIALRQLLNGPALLRAPGVHDAAGVRLASKAGLVTGFVSGAAVSATILGLPDLGYLGLDEMVAHIGRLTTDSDLPLIVDADGGFGGPLQVARTVRAYEHAGAAGVVVEDQALPKRCGHMSGKQLIPIGDMVAKIQSAVEAARDIVVIARTDAYSLTGIEEVEARLTTYAEAGADLLFPEGVMDPAELSRLHRATGLRLVVNASEASGHSPALDLVALQASGVSIVIYPVAGLLAATAAVDHTYRAIASTGSAAGSSPLMPWKDLVDVLGLPALLEASDRYASPDDGLMPGRIRR